MEQQNKGTPFSESGAAAFVAETVFNDQGLVPVIAQQVNTLEVLMMAWMTAETLRETLTTGRVVYWSRSRNKPWRKGETSNQVQHLVDARLDCDGDTVLLVVDQDGVACHTGRRSCFYRAIRSGTMKDILAVEVDPASLYG